MTEGDGRPGPWTRYRKVGYRFNLARLESFVEAAPPRLKLPGIDLAWTVGAGTIRCAAVMCEADRRQNHQRETRQQAEVLPLSDEGAIWARPRARATVAGPAAPDMYGHLCSQSAPQAANPGRLFGAAQSQCEPGGEIASTPGTGPHWS